MNSAARTRPRHAVYYAPAQGHPLWQAGCTWLGRDPRAGHPASPAARAHVDAPWRYGFHATLKAPMTLAEDAEEAGFVEAVRRLADAHGPFAMPALQVATLGEFVALRPREALARSHPLRRLADACVMQLDAWRADADGVERARQLRPGLGERQQANVGRYGYAHVLDDWRFHMTLSDPLADDDRRDAVVQAARLHFADALAAPLVCEDVCVFVEPWRGAPFELRHRIALRAGS